MKAGRLLAAICLFVATPLFEHGTLAVTVSYLYNLSDFSGPLPYDDVKLYADRRNDELYAAVGNFLRVFNSAGMEIYRFDVDPRPGSVFDVAVDESGDVLLLTLSFDSAGRGPGWFITRCDYRGQPIGRITVTGLPKEFASLRPNVMIERGGGLLLASLAQFQAIEIGPSGDFRKGYDLARLLGLTDKDRTRNDIGGFGIDRSGNLLVTIPAMFKVFVIPRQGATREFGKPGSSPGSFGIVAGVVADDRGDLIVADKARGVVMIFDDRLEFVSEFGAGDDGRPSLTRPTDLVLGEAGRLYVTQAREKGVAVFKVDPGGEEKGP